MNLILFPAIQSRLFIPRGDLRYQHITAVLKAQLHDDLFIGQINGRMGKGRIIELKEEQIVIEAGKMEVDPPKPLPLTLVLALPRPPMLQRTLSAVASLGIKKIYLLQTSRVEKSYWNSHVLNDEEIRKSCLLGLEQAKDTILPDVKLAKRFKPFVEDELPGISDGSLKILAHPELSAEVCPADVSQSVTLFVGPEGGLIPFEVDLLKQQGFKLIHLGQRILRVETAVVALISKVSKFT